MGDPSNWTTTQRYATGAAILAAESPAEAVLLVYLLCARDGDGYAVGGDGSTWRLSTQYEVTVGRANYRLDIALFRGDHRVCVEVDGHAYHHATEEQEARDIARDDAIISIGWSVVRLEARAVFQDPSGCVEFVAGHLANVERACEPPSFRAMVSVKDQTNAASWSEADRGSS